jgi:hypothetical protein
MRIFAATAMITALAGPNVHPIDERVVTTFYDVDRLVAQCERNDLACYAYIAGVTDTLATATAYGATIAGLAACIPYGVNLKQLEQTVIEFLRTHSQEVHKTAASAVAVALTISFPCTNM